MDKQKKYNKGIKYKIEAKFPVEEKSYEISGVESRIGQFIALLRFRGLSFPKSQNASFAYESEFISPWQKMIYQ